MARRSKKTQDANQEQQDQQASEDERKLPAESEGGEPTRTGPTFRPRVDIAETEAGLIILADMPGATPDSVSIMLERRQLTIRGEVENRRPEGMSALYLEYDIGAWERSFTLSGGFDVEKIEACLTDGVLMLTLPKAREPEAKRIQIKGR
jgi:HSP20 family molecular chaperone IbpA